MCSRYLAPLPYETVPCGTLRQLKALLSLALIGKGGLVQDLRATIQDTANMSRFLALAELSSKTTSGLSFLQYLGAYGLGLGLAALRWESFGMKVYGFEPELQKAMLLRVPICLMFLSGERLSRESWCTSCVDASAGLFYRSGVKSMPHGVSADVAGDSEKPLILS